MSGAPTSRSSLSAPSPSTLLTPNHSIQSPRSVSKQPRHSLQSPVESAAEESFQPKSPSNPPVSGLDLIDQPNFEAENYVRDVMMKEGVEGVANIAKWLIDGIGNLDSDRRALVYDNYSKLITATDTILKMRTRMEPLAPATSTLAPTLAHIADTTVSVAGAMKRDIDTSPDVQRIRSQRETVRWVLSTPTRLQAMLDQGDREGAEADWNEIKGILSTWSGVKGVDELHRRCEDVLAQR